MKPEDVTRSATFSIDRRYRYRLDRRWGDGPPVTWIMLNPSTADAEVDDPTIRRCMNFTESWGHNALIVVNLFAYRATNPKALRGPFDPVGPANHRHVREAITEGAFSVVAWGAHARSIPGAARAPDIVTLHRVVRRNMFCLGVTKSGAPRHPLYLRADSPLLTWPRIL